MSDVKKAAWYGRSRLALCASAAEGFGHYLLEAAAHGCLVVRLWVGHDQMPILPPFLVGNDRWSAHARRADCSRDVCAGGFI